MNNNELFDDNDTEMLDAQLNGDEEDEEEDEEEEEEEEEDTMMHDLQPLQTQEDEEMEDDDDDDDEEEEDEEDEEEEDEDEDDDDDDEEDDEEEEEEEDDDEEEQEVANKNAKKLHKQQQKQPNESTTSTTSVLLVSLVSVLLDVNKDIVSHQHTTNKTSSDAGILSTKMESISDGHEGDIKNNNKNSTTTPTTTTSSAVVANDDDDGNKTRDEDVGSVGDVTATTKPESGVVVSGKVEGVSPLVVPADGGDEMDLSDEVVHKDEEEKEENDDEEEEEEEEKHKSTPAKSFKQQLIYQARTATSFDIVPYVAIPYGSAIHSIALSRGPRWLFTGGEDGFIRKYDFISSIEGNLQLTVLQKHSLVDTMSLAGIITSYWENEQPVYKEDLIGGGNLLERQVGATAGNNNKRGKRKNAAGGNTLNGENNNNAVITSTHYEPKLSPAYSLAVQRESLWLLSGLESGGITLQTVRHNEGSIKHYFAPKSTNDPDGHNDAVDVLVLNNDEDKFLSGGWDRKILQWDLNTGDVVNRFDTSTSQVSSIGYRPVGGVDIVPMKIKKRENDDDDDDDDMDSLFGNDDDEDDEKRKNDDDKDKTTIDNDKDNLQMELHQQQNESIPLTEPVYDNNIFMSSSMDGSIDIWDIRTSGEHNVLRIPVPPSTPPWCMSACWSNDGNYIYAGRRNSTVDELNLRMPYSTHSHHSILSKVLKFPQVSGPVSVVKSMPNGSHLLCGSYDNVRLYDLRLYDDLKNNPKKLKIPFMIIPGHHGGVLSDLYVDPTCRFMVSASGNRGWNGSSTEMVLIYEINI